MVQNLNELVLDRREGLITPTELGLGSLAVATTAEVARYADPDMLSQSFVDSVRSDWREVSQGQDAFVDCSDDRELTLESMLQMVTDLREGMLTPMEGTASVFGGLSGAVMAVLQAGVATYGPAFIEKVGGFHGVARELIYRGDGSFTWHTAEGAEGNRRTFNPESEKEIACAYNEFIGTVAAVLAKPPSEVFGLTVADNEFQEVARRNQHRIFGENDLAVDALFTATYHVAEHFAELARQQTGNPDATAQDFKIDRQTYADAQKQAGRREGSVAVPIEILAGKHRPAAETGVITHFGINTVGKAGHFYRLGAGRVADEIMKPLRDLKIPAELLIRAMQMNSVPPRAVLYSHDPAHGPEHGPLDPNGLKMAWIGDPWATIQELDLRYDA